MTSISERYRALVADDRFANDSAQAKLVEKLNLLCESLRNYRPEAPQGALTRFWGARPTAAPRGVYIHGAVGRGKTMLMDLFFAEAEVPKKRRVHFHAFMADVHKRLFAWRQAYKRGEASGDDPIGPVAAELAGDASLLCFDEFAVRDIADAMILSRFFAALFAHGVVVVATSNVAPDDLYQDGLNRALFVPFIALLKERCEIFELDARTDYRLEKLVRAPVFYTPLSAKADAALDAAFLALTGEAHGVPMRIALLGRYLDVPQAAHGVARFDFDALIRRPLGSVDYLAIAERFHTVLVDRIPVMDEAERNEAKRFVTFVDALYDMRVKLIASAAAEPQALFKATEGADAFEFRRASSRLFEMRSQDYLARPHGPGSERLSADLGGIAET